LTAQVDEVNLAVGFALVAISAMAHKIGELVKSCKYHTSYVKVCVAGYIK
jgi:hypothetical protein